MQKIYLELVFLDNFMADLLILLLAARLARAKLSWGRFAFAAAVGGAYACMAMALGGAAASLPVRVATALAMCFIAFFVRGEKRFVVSACAFWAVSFVLAGAVYACVLSFGQPALIGGVIVVRPPVRLILSGLFVGAVLITILAQIRRRVQEREAGCVQLRLHFSGRQVLVKAFVDTGNLAREPITGRGVVFLSRAAAAQLLGAELVRLLLGYGSLQTDRLRIVPYATTAGQGIFYGIEIDEVALCGAAAGIRAVVCVARRALPGYGAIVGANTLDELKEGAKNEGAVTETGGMGDAAARAGSGRVLHQRQRGASAASDTSGGGNAAAAAGRGR